MPITVSGSNQSDKIDYSNKPVLFPLPDKSNNFDYKFVLFDGNDTLIGSPNSDLIYGGTGNDRIKGGAGNDVYHDSPNFYPIPSNDFFEGGSGTDLFFFDKPFNPGELAADEGLYTGVAFSEFYLIDKPKSSSVLLRDDVEKIAFANQQYEYTLHMGKTVGLSSDKLTGINIDYVTDPDDLDPPYINKDMFFSGEGNDTVLGGWGDDVIFNEVDGTQGSDYYDGGEDKYYSDFDMVIYQESLANATVGAIDMGVGKDPQLLVRIGDRLDTIVNVEQVWFGGVAYSPSFFL